MKKVVDLVDLVENQVKSTVSEIFLVDQVVDQVATMVDQQKK